MPRAIGLTATISPSVLLYKTAARLDGTAATSTSPLMILAVMSVGA